MWTHECGKRHPVIRELDIVLGKAMVQEWSGIMISVRWPRYEVILRERRGAVLIDRAACEADPDCRPLKAYRGFQLQLIVEKGRPDERISGFIGKELQSTRLVPQVP